MTSILAVIIGIKHYDETNVAYNKTMQKNLEEDGTHESVKNHEGENPASSDKGTRESVCACHYRGKPSVA